jgi:precorrin-6Y C5,15-methyltransferase (decarboxylating)
MNEAWLSIIGIGEDGLDGLSAAARRLIARTEVLVGGHRHLALIPPNEAERIVWAAPLGDTLDRLETLRGRRVCVLASGDPMWFGIGATLARRFPADRIAVIPHAGAFSLAAARLGWALHETPCLSIHGRPIETLALALQPRGRLLVLSENGASPAAIAGLLTARGFGASQMTVFERLGGPDETCFTAIADGWLDRPVDDLNTVGIELHGRPDEVAPGRAPGLPDELFFHDGQMTKREIRAATLAALRPWPNALLWDVGAGCGSVAIEWARAGGAAVAIERDATRGAMIARNAAQLGVPDISIVAGEAPEALWDLRDVPDAIFIGGGLSRHNLLDACWNALKPGGRLVANAVTAEAEAVLLAWQSRNGGDLTRLAVSRLSTTGRFHTWHPLMPVTQYLGVKR